MDRILRFAISSGEIIELAAVVFLSFAANIITDLLQIDPNLPSERFLWIAGLSMLLGGCSNFLFGARMRKAHDEGTRSFHAELQLQSGFLSDKNQLSSNELPYKSIGEHSLEASKTPKSRYIYTIVTLALTLILYLVSFAGMIVHFFL